MTRREHVCVAGDILSAIRAGETDVLARPGLTGLATRANVAFDRLQAYLVELRRLGLVVGERRPALTLAGQEFLSHFHQWNRALERFGLSDTGERFVIA
jgi:predicted transcriptional regulator